MRVRNFFILFAAFLILAGSGASWAQTVAGVITGTITDPSGAVVPNATITITNAGTNASQSVTTGSDGSYRFGLVSPGTYTVDVKAANFAEVRASGLVVEASQVVPFSIKLELAKASAVIEVTSQAPLVQTATSDLGFQVDSKTIENAALVDRDVFAALPFMAPQVMPGMTGMATSGGARIAGTSYLLNGADDNDNFDGGGINSSPPLESVEDFAIITNSMSAQYGRSAGAVVSANQKSGTNKLHGALYEQNRNATLNANDFFYNRKYGAALNSPAPLPKRPKYIKNQFGGAVGGPIRKDKTFFFVAVDRLKLIQGSTAANTFVPTTDALKFLQTYGGPLAQQVLAAYPPATSDTACPDQTPGTTGAGTQANGLPNAVGCLSFSDPVTTTQNVYYGRVDHNFSSSDRLSFAANVTRYVQVDKFAGGSETAPLANGGIPNTNTLNDHNLALIETHTFNPRLFNELNFSHTRFYNPSVAGDPAKQTAPLVIIDNQSAGCLNYNFGPSEGSQVVSFVQDRFMLQDNVTWTVGRHALRVGGSATSGILYRNWDLGLPGEYEFGEITSINGTATNGTCVAPGCSIITASSDGTLNAANGTISGISNQSNANFAGDYPYFEETSVDPRIAAPNRANAYRHYTYHDYAGFLQDDWKATSRLTLNLGLRWERFGAPSEDHGILAQFTNFGSGSCSNIHDPTCVANAQVHPVGRMWKTRNHDFGPRFGFAWDPFGNGKTAVRGSYGIYYDRIFDNIWSNGAWNPPFYALLDFDASGADSIFYSNPASIGAGYNPTNLPPGVPPPGFRVSVRTMDVNMKDSSSQNFYFSTEHQFFGGLLLRAGYQGQFGRHLPVLLNLNRFDGIGYDSKLSPVRPNTLYTGFNYRSNSTSSNYNALVVEAQKHMGHGLQFQAGYTYSKLLDTDSELFSGCYQTGGFTQPHYYVTNTNPRAEYGRGAFDHRHSIKFNSTYDLPFFKGEKGFVGHALGGWTLSNFMQMYTGHPIDVWNGRTRVLAKTKVAAGGIEPNGSICTPTAPATSCTVTLLDQNNIPFNIGGDYNLDGVANDRPVFIGSNINSVYSSGSPADGIFTDNHRIACGETGLPAAFPVSNLTGGSCPGAVTNSLFANPDYPSGSSPFLRFGTLGRNVFHGPKFVSMDLGLKKTFKLTESANLRISADAQNLFNHPNFDCIQGNLSSSTFGKAQCLVGSAGTGNFAESRVISLSARFAF